MADLIKLDKKNQSQLDPGGVLRSAHDDLSQSIRVVNGISEVPSSYSRVQLTYNSSNSITRAVFYEGITAQETEVVFTADSSGSLNNTYFLLYSENNESKYHVWYNVSGGGVDPAPAGSIGIEIPIETNDSAELVAVSTEVVLKHVSDFHIYRIKNKLIVENVRKGAADASVDFNTGFSLTTIATGTERLLKVIDVPYDSKTKYLYNTQEKRFELFEAEGTGAVEVDVQNPTDYEILNTNIPLKNIETTIALPDNTKKFLIKMKDGRGPLRFARNATETATLYWTINRGSIFTSDNVDLPDSSSIYVLSEQDNVDVQIFVWTKA